MSKIDAARITKLDTRLFWDQKVKGQGHESHKKRYRRGSLHSEQLFMAATM